MYQVITKVAPAPGSLEKIKAFFETTVKDALSQRDGWLGATLAVDSETNKIVIVGSWSSADEMQKWLADPRHIENSRKFAELVSGTAEVSNTEVVSEIGPPVS
jgi:quinol monooxygenase YgiN